MAYKPRHLMTLFLPALLLAGFAVSCTDTDVLPDAGTPSIDFGTPALTRGVVTSDADMDVFDVWGWYKPTEGSETATDTQVFNATPVTKKGNSWKYDNPQRWLLGKTYRFYAVYPSSGATNKGYESASYDKDGNLAITNFDCTKGVDLMTASREGCVADDMVADVTPVEFTFQHLLARVEFVVKRHSASVGITNFSPSVNSAKLYGMYATGDFDATGWELPGNNVGNRTDVNNPLVSMNDSKSVNNDPVTLLDVMLCPQTIEREFNFSIGFRTTDTGSYTNQTINLTTINLTKWEAGKHYRYTFTITPDDRILVEIPTVSEWGNASGGIIIVD